MKRFILIGIIIFLFILSGCNKQNEKSILKDLTKKVENNKGYYLKGEMEIINNEDVYKYNVEVSYQEPDFFRVSLINTINEHEQIILKNQEGVYVLTPSLNKSFKFQSEWPYNNSQVYLLQTLLKDLKKDDKKSFEETENYYVFTTKVNYPNNRKLVKQNIYLNKDLDFKQIDVLDENNNPLIKMTFSKVDMKADFKKNYFAVNENMKTAVVYEDVKQVFKIDNVIYPMYIPDNTHLSSQDFLERENGERVMLTFEGEKPFTLIEETFNPLEEFTIIPTYGDPILLIDTIGYVGENEVSWISSGMEYYLASEVMKKSELVEVARSMNTVPVLK
ncbi:MAG: LolA family protein [Bacilli bacterium]|jgi:outer membrane lipoprotein-sorting protein